MKLFCVFTIYIKFLKLNAYYQKYKNSYKTDNEFITATFNPNVTLLHCLDVTKIAIIKFNNDKYGQKSIKF